MHALQSECHHLSACLGHERATQCLLSHSLSSSSSLMTTVTAAWSLCLSRRGPLSVVALHHLVVSSLLARNLCAVATTLLACHNGRERTAWTVVPPCMAMVTAGWTHCLSCISQVSHVARFAVATTACYLSHLRTAHSVLWGCTLLE